MVGFDSFETKKATFITVKFNLDGFMKRYNTLSTLSRMAMGPIFIAAIVCMFACGDDSSSSIGPNDEQISEESSSSLKKLTSSSVILSVSEESSSSSAKSSSSSIQKNSSSSEKAKSSSSSVSSSSKKGDSGTSAGMTSSSVKASSSSSVKSESSSSSAKSSSSSSVILSASEESSNSSEKSSSSVAANSSDSVKLATPCKTDSTDNCEYGSLTDERDGRTYKTVKIGNQWWMAENLDYDPGQGGFGDAIYDWSWCFDNEPKNCDAMGRLYTWAAAIDSVKLATDENASRDCGYDRTCFLPNTVQGICPTGWHLPDTTEWTTLFTAVGGQSKSGDVLRSMSGWFNNGNGSDAFGFSALPAARRYYYNRFDDYTYGAYFWSATEDDELHAYYMFLRFNFTTAEQYNLRKDHAFSVRCVKD